MAKSHQQASNFPGSNNLGSETSPYLLQHANNPVNWFPWGEAALTRAREEDKPILLSIGYSACHWCHVMAHESFEDGETAALMNAHFINIKVDREERPDLDKIYQLAHQLLTERSGGWPLTVFLTPNDQRPFFAGTYFPKSARTGMVSFAELLRSISAHFVTERHALEQQNERLVQALSQLEHAPPAEAELGRNHIVAARDLLHQQFDKRYGGFGRAPKFPHPSNLALLLRIYATTALAGAADEDALAMVLLSLTNMARGGVYDQLGGGFCRYSTDDHWMIPHFEKMLYDNGPLLGLYTDAFQTTRQPEFARIVAETVAWLVREMRAPDGGFCSSLDADSEGEEGKFYVWKSEDLEALLTADEFAIIAHHYGLGRAPNFEASAWHLHTYHPVDEADRALVDQARAKLLQARELRVRPGRDDKVLVSWNALVIKQLARAGRVWQQAEWLHHAEQAADFIFTHMWRDGRLLATYKSGRAHLQAYLDDYALLLDALLALLEARWDARWLQFAVELADVLLDEFVAPDGGFYFTAHSHEALMFRPRPTMDEAMPAGAAVAAQALQRLGYLLGETRYLECAELCISSAAAQIQRYPHGHATMLCALDELLTPPETIVIRGEDEALARWQTLAGQHFAPRRQVFAISNEEQLLASLRLKAGRAEGPVAYICQGYVCDAPIDDEQTLVTALRRTELPPF